MDIPTARCDGLNVCGVPSTSEPWPAVCSNGLCSLRTILVIFVTLFDRPPAPQRHGEHRQPQEVGAEGDALVEPYPRHWLPAATGAYARASALNVPTTARLTSE